MVVSIWQLMKNLRDKWWIPRWYNEVIHTVYDKKHKMIWLYKEGKKYLELVYKKSLRDLCSKESWLWQFVCENGMVGDWKLKHNWVSQVEWWLDVDCRKKITPSDYQYRLIESTLCDEDKLEQCLLENIKVE